MNLQATPTKPAGSRERSLDEVKAEFMRAPDGSIRSRTSAARMPSG